MTINSSGPVSLNGATTGQSIGVELSVPTTSQLDLNNTSVRNLAGSATFIGGTGGVSSTSLTVSSVSAGTISVGQKLSNSSGQLGVTITSGSGTSWTLSDAVTIASGTTLYTDGTGTSIVTPNTLIAMPTNFWGKKFTGSNAYYAQIQGYQTETYNTYGSFRAYKSDGTSFLVYTPDVGSIWVVNNNSNGDPINAYKANLPSGFSQVFLTGITVDNSNNLYIAITLVASSTYFQSSYVIKFNSSGIYQQAVQLLQFNGHSLGGWYVSNYTTITVDASGNIRVTVPLWDNAGGYIANGSFGVITLSPSLSYVSARLVPWGSYYYNYTAYGYLSTNSKTSTGPIALYNQTGGDDYYYYYTFIVSALDKGWGYPFISTVNDTPFTIAANVTPAGDVVAAFMADYYAEVITIQKLTGSTGTGVWRNNYYISPVSYLIDVYYLGGSSICADASENIYVASIWNNYLGAGPDYRQYIFLISLDSYGNVRFAYKVYQTSATAISIYITSTVIEVNNATNTVAVSGVYTIGGGGSTPSTTVTPSLYTFNFLTSGSISPSFSVNGYIYEAVPQSIIAVAGAMPTPYASGVVSTTASVAAVSFTFSSQTVPTQYKASV